MLDLPALLSRPSSIKFLARMWRNTESMFDDADLDGALLERILISSIGIMIDAEDSAATVHPELSVAREQVNEQATIGSNSELSLSPVYNLENGKRVIFSKKLKQ